MQILNIKNTWLDKFICHTLCCLCLLYIIFQTLPVTQWPFKLHRFMYTQILQLVPFFLHCIPQYSMLFQLSSVRSFLIIDSPFIPFINSSVFFASCTIVDKIRIYFWISIVRHCHTTIVFCISFMSDVSVFILILSM